MAEENLQEDFIAGVVEGFYGRPWTTEQRKDLFRKLKKWGMNSYVYAPKDDYKHRAYWRELYTVEEGDHLLGLISAAKEQNINFYYALSPGLDITYSSPKEIAALKRKLEQVSQFGCDSFALCFDDIESEMSKSDKEVFQSFAHAQVTVSNEIRNHLNCSHFLFCPTQYCATRAVPTVNQSEYLNTLGSKLDKNIDILWTGCKVISKILTIEGIQEITEVLQRKPVIWDNLHANDYDQKRVFLGPYQGRSPELIPLLKGVLTNPNCEYHANTIAIHTLARWCKCSTETKVNNSISADIRLETENEDGITLEDAPNYMTENTYHPRQALKSAIIEWLPDFFQEKQVFGPIIKPHPPVASIMPIIPILPSINTCMSLTTQTSTTTTSSMAQNQMPEVNTTQLQALADVCCTVGVNDPLPNSVMNSLVSPTKVVTTDSIPNPILSTSVSNISIPNKIPISSVPIPISNIQRDDDGKLEPILDAQFENNEDIEKISDIAEKLEDKISDNNVAATSDTNHMNIAEETLNSSPSTEPMDCGSGMMSPRHPNSDGSEIPALSDLDAQKTVHDKPMKSLHEDIIMSETDRASNCSNSMQVETSSDTSLVSNSDVNLDEQKQLPEKDITSDDILLLCDLFYLPFEHGCQGLQLLNEFHWLKINAGVLSGNKIGANCAKPEVQEWFRRSEGFLKLCEMVFLLAKKLAVCKNRELCYDLFTYVWEISSVISLLSAYVKWLALGQFPTNINSFTQGTYTFFSKGWKETFTSGAQEPWVFRGGLIADLQRLIPVDSGNDLFIYKLPDVPTVNFYSIRPFTSSDEREVYSICHKTCRDGQDCTELFPENLQEIPADRLIAPFVTLHPEFCMVVENSENTLVGYACAGLDALKFYRDQEMCWVPEMCEKYPLSLLDSPNLTQTAKDSINHFHNFKYQCPESVLNSHPSIMTCCILKEQIFNDQSVCKRLISVLLAALRSHGSFGAHVVINLSDSYMQDFYKRLGFVEIFQDDVNSRLYLGRCF